MGQVAEKDVVSILDYFSELEDPRSTINRRHLLGDLIVISICAVIAGADGPQAIGVWAQSNREWLEKRLELPHGVPSHDTIGRLLATLQPEAFQSCFQAWIKSLCMENDGEEEDEHIAFDGKALRRSHALQAQFGTAASGERVVGQARAEPGPVGHRGEVE